MPEWLGEEASERHILQSDLEATIKENCQRGKMENQQQDHEQKGLVYTH